MIHPRISNTYSMLEADLTMHKMKKILIVDDEPDICLTLANVLEGNGFVVDTCDDPLLVLTVYLGLG